MAEILPDILSAFDSRKRAMVRQLAELLSPTTAVGKMTQMLASTAEDAKKMPAALDVAGSVMPEVAAQGRQELADEGLKIGGMFIGPNAKLHPGQIRAFQQARDLEKSLGSLVTTPTGGYEKITPEVIRQKTGWFQGPDGKWRTEISDQLADMSDLQGKMRVGDVRRLGDVFRHPDLYNLYPDLPAKVLYTKSNPGAILGSLQPTFSENTSHLLTTMDSMPRDDTRLTILHEIQHAIQEKEGFEPGGNTRSPAVIKYATDRMKKALEDETSLTDQDFSFEGYRRLAGEAEARATELRANLGREGRLDIPPSQSYDIPMNELIHQNTPRGSEPSFSTSDPVSIAKSQLLPYQHPVFDRLYAMTKDIAESLTRTKSLTQLMTPQGPPE